VVYSGGTLMGTGPIGDLVATGTVDPGNSAGTPGTLQSGPVQLGGGGSMKVDLANVEGVAGTDWDLIQSYADITVLGTGTFTIRPIGNPVGFDSTSNYSWKIMSGVSAVQGFSANRFTFDETDFFPGLEGGRFGVAVDGNDLYLTFTTGGGIPVWDGEGEDAKWNTRRELGGRHGADQYQGHDVLCRPGFRVHHPAQRQPVGGGHGLQRPGGHPADLLGQPVDPGGTAS
jgi:hypothetical protein